MDEAYIGYDLRIDVVSVCWEALDSQCNQVSALPWKSFEFNALVEVILGIYLFIWIVQFEPLSVKRVQFNLGVVYGILQWNGIVVGCATYGLFETDLNDCWIHKHTGFYRSLILLLVIMKLPPLTIEEIRWAALQNYWYWELRSTCTKNVLKGLPSRWVQLDGSKISNGFPSKLVIINGCSLNSNPASNILSGKLIDIRVNLRNFVSSFILDSIPLAHNWDGIARVTFSLGIQNTYSGINDDKGGMLTRLI